MNQAKVAEAPVVIIAVDVKSDLERRVDQVLREGARRGAGKFEEVEGAKRGAVKFLSTIPPDAWLNRQRNNLRKPIRDAFRSSRSFSASDTATPGGGGGRFVIHLCSCEPGDSSRSL